ncbi:MAG: nucleoside triphosphate pyrophosphohydrolase [Clostridia bacterium]|nr:nucleoside triphosphate pyrophosphohydrolase [Clostridia bacterium]
MQDLLAIMTILRAPDGCPWDSAQTHKSIRRDFIEETYEVIEAINKDDKDLLCEELGDVLMQVVFHAEIERERGRFAFADVADGICKKLIERHPHVFGDVKVGGTDDVLTNWDAIKRKSKKQKTYASAMDAVPRELPALMRSEKIQHKAAKSGIAADTAAEKAEKVLADAAALDKAVKSGDTETVRGALGTLLFDAAGLADAADIEPEIALTEQTDKFVEGFKKAEAAAIEAAQDKLWDAALQQK